jgi:hypothetical protein
MHACIPTENVSEQDQERGRVEAFEKQGLATHRVSSTAHDHGAGKGWERRQGSLRVPKGRGDPFSLGGGEGLGLGWSHPGVRRRGTDLSKRVQLRVDPRGAAPTGRLLKKLPASRDASCCQSRAKYRAPHPRFSQAYQSAGSADSVTSSAQNHH